MATIRILMRDGTVRLFDLEEYVKGVVSAEMPDAWPLEALKAQAVAARSYALYHKVQPKHSNADLCTTTHCQAWKAVADPNASRAVDATRGQAAVYGTTVIQAFYSARCSGRTRSSQEVWGGYRPYCVPVECPLKADRYGHGVGLCQWGAREFALQGRNYGEIVRHYYTGVTIQGVAPPAPPPPPRPPPPPPRPPPPPPPPPPPRPPAPPGPRPTPPEVDIKTVEALSALVVIASFAIMGKVIGRLS